MSEAPVEAGVPGPLLPPHPLAGHNSAVQWEANGSQNFPSKRDVRRERQRPPQSVLLLGVWELATELMGVKCG